VSEFDYYFVCKELGVALPDQWAAQVPYYQIVKWVEWFHIRNKLAKQEGRDQ
jgi:hypothetical protein